MSVSGKMSLNIPPDFKSKQSAKTLIIAEAGVNHNGSLDLAMQLVDVAANAGADYVKFQTFKSENLVTSNARKAVYQQENLPETDDSQLQMLKALELSEADHLALKEYCRSKGIGFLSTAFDLESIDFLHELGMDLWKIPSGEITNYPFLRKIASFNGRVVVSTGMSDETDIQNALIALSENGQNLSKVSLLHCITQYPTPMQDVNLKAMLSLKKFTDSVGYSDHTNGIEVAVAAVALGAEVIEKHFTLSRSLPGPDHKASLEPDELASMIQSIRNIEKALGDGVKRVSVSESGNKEVARKSIVAARYIKKGEVLSEENITTKRPGNGISPMLWNSVCGSRAVRDFVKDELIVL